MLRKPVFIFLFIILYGAIGFAQKSITKDTYDKLVDYVNCKYMIKFVEVNFSKDDHQLALASKLDSLKNCSLQDMNSIPDFETIKQALRPDANTIKPQSRTEKINKLKDIDIADLNDKEIVEQILSEIQTDKKSYRECIKTIRNDLENYTGVKIQAENEKSAEDGIKSKSFSWWWLWLITGAILGIAAWEIRLKRMIRMKFFAKRRSSESKVHQEDEFTAWENDKKDFENEIIELKNKIITLEAQNKDLLNENIEWGQKFESYPYKQKNNFDTDLDQSIGKNLTEIQRATHSFILYSGSISENSFKRVSEIPNENTIYELHLQNANTATFTLYEQAKQLVCKHPEFLEGCNKQVLSNQNVRIDNEGAAQRQAEGSWKIIRDLSITIN